MDYALDPEDREPMVGGIDTRRQEGSRAIWGNERDRAGTYNITSNSNNNVRDRDRDRDRDMGRDNRNRDRDKDMGRDSRNRDRDRDRDIDRDRGIDNRMNRDRDRDMGMAKGRDRDTGNRTNIGSSVGGGLIDVVAIDDSQASDRAVLWATRTLPRDHTLVFVHGIYAPVMGRISSDDERTLDSLASRYSRLCQQSGHKCKFRHFTYGTTTTMGDTICRMAERSNANSVVVGRRENISGIRRSLLGSSSQAVLNQCSIPVTLVPRVDLKERD